MLTFFALRGGRVIVYRIKYDEGADVLTIIAAEEGALPRRGAGRHRRAPRQGGRPLLIEVLRASEVVPPSSKP